MLRKFNSYDELVEALDAEALLPTEIDAQILAWVNELAEMKPKFEKLNKAESKRKGYHAVYQERRKLTIAALTERLDPDELKRLKQLAEEKVAERENDG